MPEGITLAGLRTGVELLFGFQSTVSMEATKG